MAFGFRSPYERLLSAYKDLNDDEKAKFKDYLMDINKAEDEREIDKIEETRAEKDNDTEVADEKRDEVNEESEVIGTDIDKAEALESDTNANIEEPAETNNTGFDEDVSAPKTKVEQPNIESSPEQLNEAPSIDYKALSETLEGLNAKYSALEKKFNDLVSTIATNGYNGTNNDFGISGYGQKEADNNNQDDRMNAIIRSLGGYA